MHRAAPAMVGSQEQATRGRKARGRSRAASLQAEKRVAVTMRSRRGGLRHARSLARHDSWRHPREIEVPPPPTGRSPVARPRRWDLPAPRHDRSAGAEQPATPAGGRMAGTRRASQTGRERADPRRSFNPGRQDGAGAIGRIRWRS